MPMRVCFETSGLTLGSSYGSKGVQGSPLTTFPSRCAVMADGRDWKRLGGITGDNGARPDLAVGHPLRSQLST